MIAGSSGERTLSFVRNLQTAVHGGCTVLRPHERWLSFGGSTSSAASGAVTALDFDQPLRCEVASGCLIRGSWWYVVWGVSSCACFATFVSSLVRCQVRFFCTLFNQIVYFLLLSFKNSLYNLGNSRLSAVSLQIFLPILCPVFWVSWHGLLQSRSF